MKTKRHGKILELIQNHAIDTQEELLNWLRKEGFDVTQATVSRDIKELRLVKSLSSDGEYRYSTGKTSEIDMSAKFYTLFRESVHSVDYACNTVVIKSMSGMAQAVCAAMDSLHWNGIVGTIAGDDTIFVLTRSENAAYGLVMELKKYLNP